MKRFHEQILCIYGFQNTKCRFIHVQILHTTKYMYMHWKNILHIYCSKRNGRFNGYVTVKCVQHSIAYSLLELSVLVWAAIITHSLEMPYVITTPVIISIYKASWNITHLLGEQNTAMLFPWLHRIWQTYSCCDLHSWTHSRCLYELAVLNFYFLVIL